MYTDRPNHNLIYPIGVNFCIESEESFQCGVTIQCALKNDPRPRPNFTITTTRVTNNGTKDLLNREIRNNVDQKTHQIVLEHTVLSLLFERDTALVNITCGVNNLYGNDTMTTSIQVCGELH